MKTLDEDWRAFGGTELVDKVLASDKAERRVKEAKESSLFVAMG